MSKAMKEAILRAGVWRFGDFTFASGKHANNKLDMPLILQDREASALIVSELGRRALAHKAQAVWGVPSGGQWFAEAVAEQTGLPLIRLAKEKTDAGDKSFSYASFADQQLAEETARLVGFEDVTTEMTSVAAALAVFGLAKQTTAMVAIWRRGTPEMEKPVSVPISWLVEQQIPNDITSSDLFYQQYEHLAVREDNEI